MLQVSSLTCHGVNPVMIAVGSLGTSRDWTTSTNRADHDLRPLNQQGLVLMLTR